MDDLMDEMDDHEQSVEGSRDGHARVSKMKKTTVLNTFTLFLSCLVSEILTLNVYFFTESFGLTGNICILE